VFMYGHLFQDSGAKVAAKLDAYPEAAGGASP